jgi:hypothetical protein
MFRERPGPRAPCSGQRSGRYHVPPLRSATPEAFSLNRDRRRGSVPAMVRPLAVLGLLAACSPAPKAPLAGTSAEREDPSAATEPSAENGPDACRGTPTSGTKRELVSRAEQIRSCYDALLRKDPSRQGRIVVGLRISQDGEVAAAGLVQDDLRDPDFETCALERFSYPFHSPPASGCLTVEVPMRFAPTPGG